MKKISRIEASKLQLKTYFTGRNCKNGHLSERYVTTGNCVECLKMHRDYFNSRIDSSSKWRKDVKSRLIQIKVRIFHQDRQAVSNVICAITTARHPVLNAGDVDPRLVATNTDAEAGLYRFYVDPNDSMSIMEHAVAVFNFHCVTSRTTPLSTAEVLGRHLVAKANNPTDWPPENYK